MKQVFLQSVRAFIIILTVVTLSACASITPYPQQARAWKQQIAQGNGDAAAARIGAKKSQRNHLLYSLEAGRIAQIAGDYAASQQWFNQAANSYDKEDAAARIQLSRGLQTGAALLSNDSALTYQSDPFERIFSETFQALNYLAQQDTSGAAVEFRRADHSQRQQELSHQKQIAKAEKNHRDDSATFERYEGYFDGLNTAAALARSSIQNAYSFYVAAAFWEGIGEYNDALVDYKQALQIVPEAAFLLKDIQRVSAKLNGNIDTGSGLVVVALEQGFVPAKQPITIPIPTTQGIVSVSFPIYHASQMEAPMPLQIEAGSTRTSTQSMARIDAMAARALKEKIPSMVIRQVARTTAKYALQKEANDRNALLGLATQIYNLVSEQADLRSWLSLPANAQIARLSLPPGEQTLTLSLAGNTTDIQVPVTGGGVTLVRLIQTSNHLTSTIIPITQLSGESP